MAEITKNQLEPKVCESCGAFFGCGAKIEGCWCVGLEMPEQVTIDLRSKYQDCLCPKCLGICVPVQETDNYH